MKRLALLALALTLAGPGCFYVESIDQRPSIAIRQVTSGVVDRGGLIALTADVDDPDGDSVSVTWSAYACTTGTAPAPDCDPEAFSIGDQTDYDFSVPPTRADQTTPTLAVRVTLDAVDSRGAAARPEQQLVIAIGDVAPVLALRDVSLHSFVVGSHTQLFADVSDVDDGPANVVLAWSVFTPATDATYDLIDDAPPAAVQGHRGEAKSLVANASGAWDVRVVATDPIGETATQDFAIAVTDDEPPCIASESPLAQDGDTLPLFEVTPFEVPVVTDDLDPYPPDLGDVDPGAATFAWTLQTNGGTRAPLATAGNVVTLDPATFEPGDVLELRVEIADRVPREASFAACPDADATCTFNPVDPTCAQRQTWRLEVQ